jgi:hypothetical protein
MMRMHQDCYLNFYLLITLSLASMYFLLKDFQVYCTSMLGAPQCRKEEVESPKE